MTGEEERIFSFPENISYFLEMIIQTQTEYFIRTAIQYFGKFLPKD